MEVLHRMEAQHSGAQQGLVKIPTPARMPLTLASPGKGVWFQTSAMCKSEPNYI